MHATASSRSGSRHIPLLLLAGTAAWCLLIVAAPLIPSPSIYLFFSTVCHQIPDRSWHWLGRPFAVCIRCAAIYFGFLAALLIRFRASRPLLIGCLAAMGIEVVFARVVLDLEVLRAAAGFGLGLVAAGFVERGIQEALTGRKRL